MPRAAVIGYVPIGLLLNVGAREARRPGDAAVAQRLPEHEAAVARGKGWVGLAERRVALSAVIVKAAGVTLKVPLA